MVEVVGYFRGRDAWLALTLEVTAQGAAVVTGAYRPRLPCS
jgi:hypothetical protein